jgi:uncharacterized membrane protein YoaK (UPF0700 family)
MSEAAPGREPPLPRWAPAALSFVAGYVDVYTFLALFGLFVAQVTGSLVTGAAEMVAHDAGIVGKLIAVFAFIFAAALTAALIHWIRDRGGVALTAMLALETALLVLFTVTMLAGAPIGGVDDWRGIVAGAFGAMAMGTQSVIVRLLMRGVPQTNVMTGNMTSLGIETTELIMAWRRRARDPGDRGHAKAFAEVRARLFVVLAIAVGFLLGAAAGAVIYAKAGLPGAPLSVAILAALTLWAGWRERRV